MKNFKANDYLIDFIKEKGINEVQLGNAIGKNPSTIYRITKKKAAPTRSTLKIIADHYGFDVSYFETGKMIQVSLAKDNGSELAKEAIELLREDLRYIKAKYDQLFDAFLKGNMGKLKAFRTAGSRNKDLLEVGK